MPKLPDSHKFTDVSDYGRPIAKIIANCLKNTSFTPIHVTIGFIISGIFAIACMLNHQYWAAAFFLVLKSILDAADGELARVKNTPSYVGRYFDSIADIILNFFFLLTICYITQTAIWVMFLAFIGIQLQGTLYNYYYVILRNHVNGDTTSRIFEDSAPIAMPNEAQHQVNLFFSTYNFCYKIFDRTIYLMDSKASEGAHFPKWFMTILSTFGLGFQLLIIALMLVLELEHYILPFFIGYSVCIPIFISIRRWVNR